jgi:hypothetical protein
MLSGRLLAAPVLAAALLSGGIASAPPASAGCQSATPADTYCDGPIAPDGTWQRCHQNAGGYRTYWGRNVYGPVHPPTNRCYQVDPAQPWPPLPLGQPQYHVDG